MKKRVRRKSVFWIYQRAFCCIYRKIVVLFLSWIEKFLYILAITYKICLKILFIIWKIHYNNIKLLKKE